MPSSSDDPDEELRLMKIVAARSNNITIPDQDLKRQTTNTANKTQHNIGSHSHSAVTKPKPTPLAAHVDLANNKRTLPVKRGTNESEELHQASANNRKKKTGTRNVPIVGKERTPQFNQSTNASEELHLMKIVAARAGMDSVPATESINPNHNSCGQVIGSSGNAGSTANNQRTTGPNHFQDNPISRSEQFGLMKVVASRAEVASSGNNNDNTETTAVGNQQGFAPPATRSTGDMEEAVSCQSGKGSVPRGANGPGAYSRAPGQESQRLENVQYETAVGTINGTNDDGEEFLPANVELNQSEAKGAPNEGPPEERKNHLIIGIIATGILILVALVLLLVFLLPGDSSGAETKTPGPEEEVIVTADEVMKDVIKLFPANTQNAIEAEDSPQAKAYQWLLDDPALLTYSDARNLQRYVLATMYFALTEKRWKHYSGWLDYAISECKWFGLKCHSQSNNLRSIALTENRLRGTLPEELCLLTGITSIDLQDNDIRGSIPFCLSLTIILDGNDDVVSISPTQIGLLSNLKVINFPLFGSSIPSEVGLLTSLESISLSQRDLEGKIPFELGNLKKLHTLDLSSNFLIGSIPSELGNLERLNTLDLSSNELTWRVPSELANLETLKILDLSLNLLRGSIPSELGVFTSLENLNLGKNVYLMGHVPSELGGLNALNILDLSLNDLSGSIPSELGSPRNMSQLYLERNDLSGSIPSELGEITLVYLNNNLLTGSLPKELNRTGVKWYGNANLTSN